MSDSVRFLLDGEVVTITEIDPTRTVLQWLREDRWQTGSKEGCAEGDCGACMVVIASIDDSGDHLQYRAVNACIQFVATLDGKELITVESLTRGQSQLHPVQQAMVEHHGSQCGFCTPGFVMTLFAAFKSQPTLTRTDINDALAGNLCRCTGYRPIVDAAVAMYECAGTTDDSDRLRVPAGQVSARSEAQERDVIAELNALRHDTTLTIGASGRHISAPTTIAALTALLAEKPEATILAGGTDVGLWVTKQFRDMDELIYVGEVDALKTITTTDTHLEIGAAVTFSSAMPQLVAHFPSMEPLLRRFASPPVRNAATIGGNIANGSPIGDSMPAFIALGAEIELISADGSRRLPLDAFYHDYMVNDLQPGEFVARLLVPLLSDNQVFRAYKLSKRFDQDISAVCAAFCMTLVDGRCEEIRTGFGGMAAIPARAAHCEKALRGHVLTESVTREAMAALDTDFSPLTDMRASDDYRRTAARNLLYRFYLAVTEPDVTLEVYDYARQ
ncbi:MAG: xanthine dehydrogenase small subunit [Pseudomonadota bacterium]